ncbi:molybdopterin-guanine dinucleotide biosynthesis protein MobB [Entomohabitans teleogrylli]|uniref:molybdopterin-guanine dinucleotide biosynthesis protein MobB n=1 Tax=Entomohabitans teleogrylli TaxID=1384589 RepID=UPI00073D4E52|nr:molybdopterin-guanine dinucleotide biosynthesis protein MobB [Entomohabitans teleogrylli]
MTPLLAIAARSGTGKTTLLKALIPLLTAADIRPGLIKHTHHHMDIDSPGKDSYELRKAGAVQTLLASNQRWALMTETPEQENLDLYYLASQMDCSLIDIILVEGFKHEAVPKILLYRSATRHQPPHPELDEYVIAVASDVDLALPVPQFDLNNPEEICRFIIEWLKSSDGNNPG